ncbi:hypothetical protein BRC19_01905 [Candidatus Saccharibacteria bacterium QS_5_54_17]|jgi:hypothetical protein|nr:MAG: hypothetical protein BRC19_01905 [Candidatus Saccharibacteria bacterium QS_5_54_17]
MAYTYTNYKGVTYHLHAEDVTLRGGQQQRIYYFAKEEKPGKSIEELPAGYVVTENQRNGFPVLKRG